MGGFAEVFFGGYEAEADVVVAVAGGVEARAGEEGYAVAEGALGEGGAVAVGEADPEGLAAGDFGDGPGGDEAGEVGV